MSRKAFYDKARESVFNGKLSQMQVQGMDAILDQWTSGGYEDKRWLAYVLATVYHETAKTMYPIEEYGKGRGKRYGRKIMHSGKPYTHPDVIFYGRGQVQLTWYENYKKYGEIFNLPLLEKPELMLIPEISAKILIHGMVNGGFTGVGLKRYFNGNTEDWVNARRIINGVDKAKEIAEYGKRFLYCVYALK